MEMKLSSLAQNLQKQKYTQDSNAYEVSMRLWEDSTKGTAEHNNLAFSLFSCDLPW